MLITVLSIRSRYFVTGGIIRKREHAMNIKTTIETLSEPSARKLSDNQLDAASGGRYSFGCEDPPYCRGSNPENPLMTAFYTGICMGLMGF